MANYWDDEEWWKKHTATHLYDMWRRANSDEEKNAIKDAIALSFETIEDLKTVSSYDLLSYLKVLGTDNLKNEKLATSNSEAEEQASVADVVYDEISRREKDLESKEDLISRLQRKSLLEAAKIVKTDDTAQNVLNAEINGAKEKIEQELKNIAIENVNDEVFVNYDNAEKSGAIEDISQEAKDSFVAKLAEANGWDLVDGKTIENNDSALNNAVKSLDAYNAGGNLNDLYSDCAELLGKIKYEFASDISEADQKAQTKAYNQLLLANAAQRATIELLKDKSSLVNAKTNDEVLNIYKSMVAQQLERGVVLAGLSTDPNLSVLMENITRDKDGNIIYKDGNENIENTIAGVLNGDIKLTSAAISVDTWWLENVEIPKVKTIIKPKADVNKLSFFKKCTNFLSAAYDNVVKKGGWKKIAVNVTIFGGAAALMAGPGWAIATGASIYAGWSTANAWLMPVYDSLTQEMHAKNIKGLGNKIKYIKENWARAKKAKMAEDGFKSRAWYRTAEGLAIGGLTGGIGAVGAIGSWTGTLLRQGSMIAGKAGSFFKSLFTRKSKKTDIINNGISVKKLQALRTAEGYLKQDKVALGAVVAGSVVCDLVKFDIQNDGPLTQAYNNVKELISNDTHVSDTTDLESVVSEQNVTPASETHDFSNVKADTNSTSIKVIGDGENEYLVAEIEVGGERSTVPVEYDESTGEYSANGTVVARDGSSGIELTEEGRVFKMQANEGVEAQANTEFQPYTDEKTGMTVWKEVETKNGVTETYMQDAKGNNYIRYEGLSTDHQVSEATYARLVNTINDKGNLNFTMKDGSQFTFKEAVEMMRERLRANPDRLPEGMGENQAIYLAMMRARYTGKIDILNDIKCNDNELTLLVEESKKYATNPGHIGRLITNRPLPTRVGPASEIGDPCTPSISRTTGLDVGIDNAEVDITSQNPVSNNVTVDMEDPHAEVETTYSRNKDNYPITLDSIAGEGSQVKGGDVRNFVTFVSDTDGVVTLNGTESSNIGVNYYAPHDATKIIANLKTPTSVVTDETTGATTITYEFEKGKTVSVILDKANNEGMRVGHFLINGKECIIDTQSSTALTHSLTENGVDNATYVSVNEDNMVPEGVPSGYGKIDTKIEEIANAQKGAIVPEEVAVTPRSIVTEPTTVSTPVQLTTEQINAIKFGENTQFTCTAIEDGKAVLAISGVEGVDRIKVVEPVHLDMRGATYTSEGISTYSTERATVTINTADSQELQVTYENGRATATMGNTPVLLDKGTCEAAEALTEKAFRDKHIDIEIDLHNSFTDKVVNAIETFKNNNQSTSKELVSTIMHQTKSGNKGMA
ncbi:MAG: hypothetical protein E7020_06395 [Alphaproteobacteria bacterium]|nr:hypothetical protein [Alphaproteobacteria bacterium]